MPFTEPCYVKNHDVGLVVASLKRSGSRLFPANGHTYAFTFPEDHELKPVRSICSIGYTCNILPFEVAYVYAHVYKIQLGHTSVVDFNRRNHVNEDNAEILIPRVRGL